MTTNQPDSIENRLSRLEMFFADTGESMLAQNDTIDVLVTNINPDCCSRTRSKTVIYTSENRCNFSTTHLR